MKKILSILLVAALATPMFAEQMTPEERGNADYSTWLPAAGEFSVGFSVDPFANFIGKMFQTAQAADYNTELGGKALVNPIVSIMGSYMLTDQLAVKGNIGIIVDYTRQSFNVLDDAARFANPLSLQQVNDVVKQGQYGGSFAFGAEYRLGKRRVQGVFGAGLVYAFQTYAAKYSYGNAITEINQKPTVTADPLFPGTAYKDDLYPGVYTTGRLINDAADLGGNDAMAHRFGLYTTVGVEFFLAPKVALGLNVNLDLLYKWSSNSCRQYEAYNLLTGEVDTFTDTRNVYNYKGVTFNTENIGANLYLNFWF